MAKRFRISPALNARMSFNERCDMYAMPIPVTGCWLWTGYINKRSGYGIFSRKGKSVQAHCESYKTFKGDTNGLCVLHTCDVRSCVNPDHLFLGTRTDNIRDMDKKGRRNTPKGEAHRWSILTQQQVDEIRELPKTMGSGAFLARKYGVSNVTICSIRKGTRWAKPKLQAA